MTHLELKKRQIEDAIVSTSCGLTVIATEVAGLSSLEAGSGLRYLDERMLTPLAFLTEVATLSNSSSGSTGRYEIRRKCLARWASLVASLKGSYEEFPTGKYWLSREVRSSKKGMYAAARVQRPTQ